MRYIQLCLALFVAVTLALPIAPRSDPLAGLLGALTGLIPSATPAPTTGTAVPDIAAWKRYPNAAAEAEAAVDTAATEKATSVKISISPAIAAWKRDADANSEFETIFYEGVASAPIEERGKTLTAEAAAVKPEIPAW